MPPAPPTHLVLAVLAAATLLCAACTVLIVASGANLLHYDAKAHLIVSRRVLDNITPGWFQLGAVWLPLPHILNALPTQSDALYRSGAAASAIGCISFLVGLGGLAFAAARATGDRWAGVLALAVPLANPGWLYLQATPLSEPIFIGPLGGLVFFLVRWRQEGHKRHLHGAAVLAALACLVRYEAWPIVALSAPLVLRARQDWPLAVRYVGLGLVAPVLYFGFHSWITDDILFYVMPAYHLTADRAPLGKALGLVAAGLREAFGLPLLAAAAAALLVLLVRRGPLLGPALACLGALAVTLTAYLAGHPTHARYALLLAPALALALAGATRGWRLAQALALVVVVLQTKVVPSPVPVIAESTRWIAHAEERQPVVHAFRREYRGGRMLASMASSAPFLYELQLPVREVVFEGNKKLWRKTLGQPQGEVAWLLVTEADVVDRVHRQRPQFLDGFQPFGRFRRSVLYRAAQGASAPMAAKSLPSSQPTRAAPSATPANSRPDRSSGLRVSAPLKIRWPSRCRPSPPPPGR